jgi:hypothetical protein
VGVPASLLSRLAIKEFADNGLDEGEVGRLDNGDGYFVADNGPGLDGSPEKIAELFSIARPTLS